ncbi:MAG: hypothetical protein MJA82_08665 [Clostridia bacterium]|nr:hypothetical protein [Clostridia bacterium]
MSNELKNGKGKNFYTCFLMKEEYDFIYMLASNILEVLEFLYTALVP